MPALDAILEEKIAGLVAGNRFREPRITARSLAVEVLCEGKKLQSFSCNDYLALSHHPRVIAAAQEALGRYGAGAGASRLVTGNHPLYAALEQELAACKHTEAAMVFGSGYLANIGAIPALVGKGDLVIADKLVHACMIDGILLSGAKLLRFPHNDVEACGRLLLQHRQHYRHCLVATETVFSMDGDCAPLTALRDVCDRHGAWLMTDDAHGLGDPSPADIQMGTLSKAAGSYGGYICGSHTLVRYLRSAARSFIFATGLPPATVAAAAEALRIIREEPERKQRVLDNARLFTRLMHLPEAQSPIVPFTLGSEASALQAAQLLEDAGFLVAAIRPPTVPEGTARLRFTFSSEHTPEQIHLLHKAMQHAGIGA